MDHDKVMAFMGQVVTDMAAVEAAGSVVVGYRLGLYRSLAEGPATPTELAARTGLDERYLQEWLRGQAAGGWACYDEGSAQFFLSPEQAFCLADDNGPNVTAALVAAVGMLRSEPLITAAFRTGEGVGWAEHHEDVFVGSDAFYRPGYVAALVPSWIPALDGVEEKLRRGALVADVGCGLGSSSVLLAEAFPRSTVVGSDTHAESIGLAEKKAAEAGVADRLQFEVASAQTFSGDGYDLVATFDALHDMGDPVGAARHIRSVLAPDGTWLLVEPAAADTFDGTVDPVSRLYYSGSTFLCVPNALSQSGGHAMGAQAGEAATRQVALDAGFTRVRVVARTAFNLVYEVRP